MNRIAQEKDKKVKEALAEQERIDAEKRPVATGWFGSLVSNKEIIEADKQQPEEEQQSDCTKPGPPILISNTAASLPFKLTWSPPKKADGEILIYKVIYRLVGAESPDGEKWFTLTTTRQTFWDID
jgi:hypothetical protein